MKFGGTFIIFRRVAEDVAKTKTTMSTKTTKTASIMISLTTILELRESHGSKFRVRTFTREVRTYE